MQIVKLVLILAALFMLLETDARAQVSGAGGALCSARDTDAPSPTSWQEAIDIAPAAQGDIDHLRGQDDSDSPTRSGVARSDEAAGVRHCGTSSSPLRLLQWLQSLLAQ